MSISIKAATTALTGCVIFGFASAAFAHHVPQQPFVESESVALLNVVKATGHKVFIDVGPCLKEKGLFGFASTRGALVICTEAHGENKAELADTIRHEALHLAQFCKGRKSGATAALLAPDIIDESRRIAIDLHMPVSSYEPHKRDSEAEARAGAYALDEHEVAGILIKECGLK